MSSGLQAYSSPPPEVTVKDAADIRRESHGIDGTGGDVSGAAHAETRHPTLNEQGRNGAAICW